MSTRGTSTQMQRNANSKCLRHVPTLKKDQSAANHVPINGRQTAMQRTFGKCFESTLYSQTYMYICMLLCK